MKLARVIVMPTQPAWPSVHDDTDPTIPQWTWELWDGDVFLAQGVVRKYEGDAYKKAAHHAETLGYEVAR